MRALVKKRFRGAMVEIEVEGKDAGELVARLELLIAKLTARDIAQVSGARLELETLFSERTLEGR